jgi:hypothetical protein
MMFLYERAMPSCSWCNQVNAVFKVRAFERKQAFLPGLLTINIIVAEALYNVDEMKCTQLSHAFPYPARKCVNEVLKSSTYSTDLKWSPLLDRKVQNVNLAERNMVTGD